MYLGGLYLTPPILGQGWGQKLMDLTQQLRVMLESLELFSIDPNCP